MKSKKRRFNPYTPNITMQGTNLDRLLSGHETPELRKEIYKSRGIAPPPVVRETILYPSNKPPLIAVMFRNHCRCCGLYDTTFGYLARSSIEKIEGGTITRITPVADPGEERPKHYLWQGQTVPYCWNCIPNGITPYDDQSGRDSGGTPPCGFAPSNAANAAIDGTRNSNLSEEVN